MPAATFTVTATPQVLFRHGQNQPADTVVNTGTTSVYVDNQPQITTTQGFQLNPGALYPVEAGDMLSVVAPAPGTVQLLGRSGLTFWDPSEIANQINLQGVPAIDQATRIYGAVHQIARSNTTATPVIDASRFSTLDITATETNGAAGSVTTELRVMNVNYFSDAAGTLFMGGDSYRGWPSGGSIIAGPMACKGPFVKIDFETITSGVSVSTIDIDVFASMRQTANNKVELVSRQVGAGFMTDDGDSGVIICSTSYPVGTSDEFPSSYAGVAQICIGVSPTTNGNSSISLRDIEGAQQAFYSIRFATNAANQSFNDTIYLPSRPFLVRTTNNNAAALGMGTVIVMDGNRY